MDKSQALEIIKAAIQAPSGGNVQPWLFKIKNDSISIYLDRKRSTSFLDVGRYASIFSVGSAIENMIQTAHDMKLEYKILLTPDAELSKPIATLSFQNLSTKHGTLRPKLYPYIFSRTTNRKLHTGRQIPEKHIQLLEETVKSFHSPNFRLRALSKNIDKAKLGEILGRADIIRTYNDKMFDQMMKEMRWNPNEARSSRDGLDVATLELPKNVSRMLQLLAKKPKLRKLFPKSVYAMNAKQLINLSSHVCCLTTTNDINPSTMLLAGQILQRIWLLSTKLELNLHPWTVITFFIMRNEIFNGDDLSQFERDELTVLKKLISDQFKLQKNEFPLFIFRLFQGAKPTARALRLPIKQVLID